MVMNFYIFINLNKRDLRTYIIHIDMNISKPLFTTALYFAILLAVFSSCSSNERNSIKHGMVVSAHPEASAIGIETLKKGGNAVDAACAVELALAVSYPVAGNIGGGGFMIVRLNNGESFALDYREKAPLASTKDMYLDKNGEVVEGLSTDSHLAVGVPGTVDGIIKAHSRFGKLNFKDIIQPAIDLAKNGFPITQKQAGRLNSYKDILTMTNSEAIAFVKKAKWKQGDILKQPELAKTLELIRDFGRDGFYGGITADKIVEQMKKHDGIITHRDLSNYSSVWREPITGQYRGVTVISMPPPSSGGIALMQLLSIVEPYPVNEWGWHDVKTIHLMVEAERRVYADRAEFLGDPDFYKVPAEGLLNKEYLKLRMSDFNLDKATPSEDIKHGNPTAKESEETTHYSVVDKFGNAVAVTTTLNRGYGSKIVVDGAGFLLNNEMDDFSSKPGFPNSYGLVGGDANAIQPEKRMLSSMTPAILEKNGKLFMVVGSPGGSTIITSVFQTVMNVVDFDMNMQQAVAASRFHSQWLPDLLYYEKGCFTDSMKNQLEEMGHILKERGSIGRVDAILCKTDGSLEGGADPRGDDIAMSTAQQ
jgi:gamma-glutamyltranspeptidase/glutathione hydrolase